ncbi:MAG TPA: alpha/beta hydrolase [Acidimicrobiia bacterium]|jgi:pimeloyl-ACP methyl ester carboxylesterase
MTSVAFAHATGFCGAVWRPVASALESPLQPYTWDFPCHGGARKLDHPIDWWTFGQTTLDQVGSLAKPLIGVGHSMGGAALVMAEVLKPGTFDALVLIEPIIFPPPFERSEDAPMAVVAERRRREFESREAARTNFVSKLPFSRWHRSALDGYLEDGLIDTESGCRLACWPEDEAEIYRASTAHGVWDRMGELQPPTLIMAGELSDTHPPHFVESLAARPRRSGFELVMGTGHFLPMEKPDLVVRRIQAIATGIGA